MAFAGDTSRRARSRRGAGAGRLLGLSAAHHGLPRGRYDRVQILDPLSVILQGPAHRRNGTVNLIGGLCRAVGVTGYETLARLREARLTVLHR